MKKFLLTALVSACTATCVTASPSSETAQVLKKPSDFFSPVEKTYIPGVYSSAGWKANWFAGVSGGFSTYLGHNVSENDFFGRTRWIGRAQVGKWLTPSFATRIGFDAFAFEDVDKRNENYQVYHLDLMWNPVAEFTKESAMPKWGVMPYLGVGLAHNSTFGINRFAFDYGVAAKLRVAPRIDLTAELGGVTTWRDLDGCGCCREFNANFLSLSVGASIVIGQDGWKRVVDAKPYIKRNEDLMAYSLALRDVNRGLGARLENDQRVLAEYRKILGIEGLLGKYGSRLSALEADSIVAGNAHPRNNYRESFRCDAALAS